MNVYSKSDISEKKDVLCLLRVVVKCTLT